MKTDKRVIAFAAFYLCFYAGIACIASYLSVFMETCRGYTGSQLGSYNGITGIATILILPFMGTISHSFGGTKRTVLIFLVLGAAAILCLNSIELFPLFVLAGSVENISKSCARSAADTQVSEWCNQNEGNYGALRSFGSFGYTFGSIALGVLAGILGLKTSLFPLAAVFFLLALAAAVLFPSVSVHEPARKKTIGTAAALKELAGNRQYRLLIFITVFSAFTLDCNLNYIGNHLVTTLGAPDSIISLNTACCVIPELLLLPLVSRRILPKYGYRKLYAASAVILILRCIFYLLVKNPYVFVLGSLLHCVAIGCNPVAGLAFAADVTRSEIYGSAVAVYLFFEALARAVYGYIGGWIYQLWGSYAIFAVLLVINLISAAVIFRTKLFETDKNVNEN